MLLQGKKLLVTGVLTPDSIAFPIADLAQREGAEIVLTGAGRGLSLTERSARRLQPSPKVLPMNATESAEIRAVADELGARWGTLDGIVHSMAFAPADALGGNFLTAPWESVQQAFRISTYSLQEISAALLPLMKARGGSIVTLDFDTTVAWPGYDWMGVCKAGLESVVRYLARDLGRYRIRVNAICAGPLQTVAAKGIAGFSTFAGVWGKRAPLGWDSDDRTPVARMAAVLLSDWTPATTGEMIHVDGGYHAMGADLAPEGTPD